LVKVEAKARRAALRPRVPRTRRWIVRAARACGESWPRASRSWAAVPASSSCIHCCASAAFFTWQVRRRGRGRGWVELPGYAHASVPKARTHLCVEVHDRVGHALQVLDVHAQLGLLQARVLQHAVAALGLGPHGLDERGDVEVEGLVQRHVHGPLRGFLAEGLAALRQRLRHRK